MDVVQMESSYTAVRYSTVGILVFLCDVMLGRGCDFCLTLVITNLFLRFILLTPSPCFVTSKLCSHP